MKHDVIRLVDHRHPIHDSFCRCRRCKPSQVTPPLVGMSPPARRHAFIDRALILLFLVAFWGGVILSLIHWRA